MTELRPSQQAALDMLTDGRHFAAIWSEPRCGKTAVALRWLQHLGPGITVVVGPKIAEGVWRSEAAKWLTCGYRFHPLTRGNAYPSVKTLDMSKLNILFVNYEQFTPSPYRRLKPLLRELSRLAGGYGRMILDESHAIKTPRSVIGRAIRPLAASWHYRLIITGTPVTNPGRVDEVYGQWTFLDPSIRDRWPTAKSFREYFGEWRTVKGFPELVRPLHQYELSAYLRPHVVTLTRPDSTPVPVVVARYDPPQEVTRALATLARDRLVRICDIVVTGLNPLTRLVRSRQLVCGVAVVEDTERVLHWRTAARARTTHLLSVLASRPGKVVIACSHLAEIAIVQQALAAAGIECLVLRGKTRDKAWALERFQRARSIRALIVQPRTVSMAVDISVAETLIWYSTDFNYVTFRQCSDRIKLNPGSPTVYVLCALGTVDEQVFEVLKADHDYLVKTLDRVQG